MTRFPRLPLQELCEKITDGTHHSPPNGPSGEFMYVTAKNIKPWGLDLEDISYVDSKTHSEIYARCDVRKGDVLYVKDGAGTGAVAINELEEPFSLLSSVGVLRPGPALLPKYLLYALQEPTIKQTMLDNVAGVAITRLTLKKLNAAEIPVAPLAEQVRIVAKLEELLSDLDAGVAELKAAQKKLQQYRQSLLKAAVEGALTADWREAQRQQGTPTETGAQLLARILTERRARWEAKQLAKFKEQGKAPPKDWQKKYPEPKVPVESEDVSIPSEWTWTGLEQLSDGTAHGLKAGPFGSALKKEFYVAEGYKIYGQEQVIRGDAHYGDYYISDAQYRDLESCAVKPGDLLISLVGTTGKILVLPDDARPGIINPRLLKISLAPRLVLPNYIKVVLESPYARHFYKLNAHGGTMDVLNLGILKSLAIPLPSVSEQLEIVQRLAVQFESIGDQAAALEVSLKQATVQRQNVLRAAFAGHLVKQDPNEEPACNLIERIRAERALSADKPKTRRAKDLLRAN